MALEKGFIHIPFMAGMSQQVDERLLPVPCLKWAENVRPTKDGALKKRYGFVEVETGISPIDTTVTASPSLLVVDRIGSQGGRPFMMDGRAVYGVHPSGSVYKGEHSSLSIRRRGFWRDVNQNVTAVDSAVGGTYICLAYRVTSGFGGGSEGLFVTLINLDNGEVQRQHWKVASGSVEDVRVVACGGYFFVYYIDSAPDLKVVRISEGLLIANAPTTVYARPDGPYEVYSEAGWSAQYLAVSKAAVGIVLQRLDTASPPTVLNTNTIALAGTSLGFGLHATASNFHVAWLDDAIPPTLYYSRYNPATLALTAGPVTMQTGISTGGSGHRIGVCEYSATHALVWWEDLPASAVPGLAQTVHTLKWRGVNYSTAAVFGGIHFRIHLAPTTRGWVQNGDVLFGVGGDGWQDNTQAHPGNVTYPDMAAFIRIRPADLDKTAHFFRVAGQCMIDEGIGLYRNDKAYHLRNVGQHQGKTFVTASYVPPGGTLLGGGSPVADLGHDLLELNPSPRASRLPEPLNQLSVVSGGVPSVYDGVSMVEFSFPMRPLIVVTRGNAGSGSLVNGTYQIGLMFEFRYADGTLSRSPAAIASEVTTSGAENEIEVCFRSPTFSNKHDPFPTELLEVKAIVYRSLPGGSILYESNVIEIRSDATDYYQTFLRAADADVGRNQQMYIHREYEATSIGSCGVVREANGRLFAISDEDPSIVFYSKPLVEGFAPDFNVSLAAIRCSDEIVSVSSMDGRTFLHGKEYLFIVEGSGPDRSGAGEVLTAQRLAAARCASPHLVQAPDGVYYLDGHAFSRITRKLEIDPGVGRHLEDLLSDYPTCIAAVYDAVEHLCRFWLTNDEVTIEAVYHWPSERWAINTTGQTVRHGAMVGNVFYRAVGGGVEKEDKTVFFDATQPYTQVVEFGFARADDGIATLKRFRRLSLLGKNVGTNADVQVVVRYNDNATPTTTHSFAAPAPDGMRCHLKYQKSRSVSGKVTVTDDSGEGVELNGITIELGMRYSSKKLPTAASK